jgi:AcrR family transcriptional regulator
LCDEKEIMNAGTDRECEVCGRPVVSSTRGRPRRYCSHACRERAYRMRVAAGAEAGSDLQPGSNPAVPTPRPSDNGLTLERIVEAATAVADRDGADALSMRRTAEELGAGVMSLYRHVHAKEQLIDLVVDAAFASSPLPEHGPEGWRAKLELSARQEWAVYEQRPWVAPLVASTTRPPIAVNLMHYTDWRMRALDGQGLDADQTIQVAVALSTFVQGAALALAHEDRVLASESGTQDLWQAARRQALQAAFDSGRLPLVSRFGAEAARASRPRAVFDFGLARLLDGIEGLTSR